MIRLFKNLKNLPQTSNSIKLSIAQNSTHFGYEQVDESEKERKGQFKFFFIL